MGLTGRCRSYLGQQVVIRPFYGWGWHRHDPDLPPLTYEEKAGPAPFRAVVTAFFKERGEIRGGTGIIRDSGHSLDGQFVVFSTRHVGTFEFTAADVAYSISIGRALGPGEPPRIDGPPELDGWANITAS
jgi:hypothetical protein